MRRYAITTFGCQMNVHDSDRMDGVLLAAGYEKADSAEGADVVVLNTCSVREKAEQKLLSELGRLAKRKRLEPGLTVVVAGCVAQQEGERLLRGRGVDVVLGPDNVGDLPALLDDLEAGGRPIVRTVFDLDAPRFLTTGASGGASVSAFVTTMKGCDERCSFCIVPTTRGPERYRPSDEVVAEIDELTGRGAAEVTLLGQTVNSYRDPSARLPPAPDADLGDADESEFAALLRAIAARVPRLRRLRYTSPHPRHLTRSLIRAHAELGVLPRHVHLPVQSGSDRVLRRMIRRYTRAEYGARVGALRAAVPGVTLSTDVIVGFPGESEEDFEQTLGLVEETGFVGVFGFKYSPRPGTPALKLGDDVPPAQKAERLARLFALSEALVGQRLRQLVDTEQLVLLEGRAKRAQDGATRATFSGRTAQNEIVHVDDPAAERLVGQEVRVRITRAFQHSLLGELGPEAVALGRSSPRAHGARALPVVR